MSKYTSTGNNFFDPPLNSHVILLLLLLTIGLFVSVTYTVLIAHEKTSPAQYGALIKNDAPVKSTETDNSLPRRYSLIAVGDVLLGRSINARMVREEDFTWPFAHVADVLRSADITLINLEGTLTDPCQSTVEGMRFCGDLQGTTGLVHAGIDVANIANNHITDYGTDGINQTITALRQVGIMPIGTNSIEIHRLEDFDIAFLGYTQIGIPHPMIGWGNPDRIMADIRQAKTIADAVIVTIHWGTEYQSVPSDQQRGLAHAAIDEGATLVIGHHPHWVQPVEYYNDGIIVYSLGNFVMDQMWSMRTRQGIIAKFTISHDGPPVVSFTPVRIDNYGQPVIVEGIEKDEILRQMQWPD